MWVLGVAVIHIWIWCFRNIWTLCALLRARVSLCDENFNIQSLTFESMRGEMVMMLVWCYWMRRKKKSQQSKYTVKMMQAKKWRKRRKPESKILWHHFYDRIGILEKFFPIGYHFYYTLLEAIQHYFSSRFSEFSHLATELWTAKLNFYFVSDVYEQVVGRSVWEMEAGKKSSQLTHTIWGMFNVGLTF